MPTLKEIKDMLVKAEQEAEQAIESVFESKEPVVAATQVDAEPVATTTQVGAEPVFVTEKAYGQVDGIPGVKYQQDGEYFDSQRKFVRKA